MCFLLVKLRKMMVKAKFNWNVAVMLHDNVFSMKIHEN